MPKKILIIAAAAAVFISFNAQAAQRTIVFFVGKVHIVDGRGKKTDAVVNMTVADTSTIVTGRKSYAMIQYGELRYTVRENTSVKATDLAKMKEDPSDSYAAVRKVYDKLRTDTTSRINSAAATRAADPDSITAGSGVVFDTGEDDGTPKAAGVEPQLYADMSEQFRQKNFTGTIRLFEKNGKKSGADSPRVLYLAAMSNFYLGKYARSSKIFSALASDKKNPQIASDAVFYEAFSRQNLLEFAASNELFGEYLSREPRGTYAPFAYYLRGINYLQLEDEANAQEQFNTVIEKYPDDALAGDARLMIKAK